MSAEQLEIPLARALPPDPGVADLEAWLAEAPSWLSAEDIAAATRWDDRRIRDLASESDLVISSPGKRGYPPHPARDRGGVSPLPQRAPQPSAQDGGQGHPHRPHLLSPPGSLLMTTLSMTGCCYCGGDHSADDCPTTFTPIEDCEHKDPEDGCCHHPKNITPECHVGACPRLHRRIYQAWADALPNKPSHE